MPAINANGTLSQEHWVNTLRPYAGMQKSTTSPEFYYWPSKWMCPAATKALGTTNDSYPGCNYMAYSYGMNSSGYPPSTTTGWRGLKVSQVVNPSAKIFMVDATWLMVSYSQAKAPNYYYLKGEYRDTTTYNVMTAYRHARRVNLSYYDGHVANRAFRDIWDIDSTTTSPFYASMWYVRKL